jgi:small-conductance mechanosensitive channel
VKPLDKITLAVIGLLLVAAVAGYVTTEAAEETTAARPSPAAPASVVDRRPFRTAQRLAAVAETRDERDLAQEALRLGDHSIDLAFTIALLEAAEHPPALTPETKAIQARIDSTRRLIADDSARVAQLAGARGRRGMAADQVETEREVAAAQLELHRGELADAKDDLIRAGGDPQGRIRQMVADHDSTEHAAAGTVKPAAGGEGPGAAKSRSGLLGRLERWRALTTKQAALDRGRDESIAGIPTLTAQRQEFVQHMGQAQADSGGDLLSRTRHLSTDQKVLAGLTQRIEDQVSLLDVYSRWGALVADQRRAALHAVLLDCVWLLLILLGAVGIGAWVEHLFAGFAPEHRRLQTLRTVTRFTMRGLAVVAGALILLGPPSQLATIIGLAGAGLTVVLKDFIVGFFGWFALMGRNGIRVGDWVEINGVSGVVIEITPFHTVLLETGNWTDAGHPTGRQVTFSNAFAIEGHYFNFSTSGQWLWDEVEFELPTANAPAIIQSIRKMVTDETAENARQAEQEWGRVTTGRVTTARAVTGFSAEPAIDVRPGPGGTHVLVRYITRAQDRHRFRTRLYQAVVELLGGQPTSAWTAAPTPAT